MDLDEIKYLLQKYSDNSISEMEKKKLFSFISELDPNILESVFFQNFNENLELGELGVVDQDKMWDAIRQAIYANQISSSNIVFNWKKLITVAAAVISIATISIVVFYHQKNKESLLTQTSVVEDILPGRDRAILTLSNGKKVDLDTLSVGVIIADSNTIIEKLENGNIRYTSKSASQNIAKTNTIETPAGGTYQVSLPDGSKVWLNAMSKLKYPVSFFGETRDIELEGEAYFEIAKDKNKPFIVHLGQGKGIKVLGTHFNTKSYSVQEMSTTVLEGAVGVYGYDINRVIKPNSKFEVNNNNTRIIDDVDVNQIMSWKNGYFSQGEMSLSELLSEISRWYDVKIENKDNINMDLIITVKRDNTLQNLIKILELTKELKFELNNKTLKVINMKKN